MQNDFVLSDGCDIQFLQTAFPEVEFGLYQSIINENVFFSAISCWVDDERILGDIWRRVNSFVGSEYQTKLEDEFSTWNIYLVFFLPNKITSTLKYSIENDVYFVRKIVFDNIEKCVERSNTLEFLNDHILGKDISIDPQLNQESVRALEYSSFTQSLLDSNLPLGRAEKDKKAREAWLEKTIQEVCDDEI